jgi:pimeloyl-ACP methyl ester carboxylesterase
MWKKIVIALVVLLALAAAVILRPDRDAAEVDAQYRTERSKLAALPDGTRMHYLEAGPADAPVLMLIHGSFDSAFTWELVLDDLAKDFHVIAPDLPAHGLTGRTPTDSYQMADMASAVHGLVTHLKLEPFVIGGNSMGGNTSWLYAHAHPDRVRRMVLIDSAGYPNDTPPLTPKRGPIMNWLMRHGNPTLHVRRGFYRAVEDDTLITDARVERSVDFLRRAGSRDAQRKRNRDRQINTQPIDRVREIQTPTLVVWGDRDELLPVEAAHRFHADLPNSELVIYEGIGHMPQLEAPARLVKDIRAFLQKPDSASAAGADATAPDAGVADAGTPDAGPDAGTADAASP